MQSNWCLIHKTHPGLQRVPNAVQPQARSPRYSRELCSEGTRRAHDPHTSSVQQHEVVVLYAPDRSETVRTGAHWHGRVPGCACRVQRAGRHAIKLPAQIEVR
jgi:hypothetical protein